MRTIGVAKYSTSSFYDVHSSRARCSHYKIFNIYQKMRFKPSPWIGDEKAVEGWRGFLAISNRPRERSFAEHSVRMGWRGFLAISNRPRERSFAEHSVGWDGEVSRRVQSRVSCRAAKRHIQSPLEKYFTQYFKPPS